MPKAGQIEWTDEVIEILRRISKEGENWKDRAVLFKSEVEKKSSTTIDAENKATILSKADVPLSKTLSAKFSKLRETPVKVAPKQFEWSEKSTNDLIGLYNKISPMARQHNKSETELWMKIQQRFWELYPEYKITPKALQSKFNREIQSMEKIKETTIDWQNNKELVNILSDCAVTIRTDYGLRIPLTNKEEVYRKIHDLFCLKTTLSPTYQSIRQQIILMNLLGIEFNFSIK